MNKKGFIQFLRENIIRLLEEETKYNPGDTVDTQDGTGIVQLSKHPYYSVKLDSTGVTKSFHFTKLQESEPIESEFGKYDIDNEDNSLEQGLDELQEIKINPPGKIPNFQTFEDIGKWAGLDQREIDILFGGVTSETSSREELLQWIKNNFEGTKQDKLLRYYSELDEIKIERPGNYFPSEFIKYKDEIDHYIKYDNRDDLDERAIRVLNYILQNSFKGDWKIKGLESPQELDRNILPTLLSRLKIYIEKNQLNESSLDKIIKFSGILTIQEGEYLTDILSDIRSLQGVTIVRNEDIEEEDQDKSKLFIKVDPYPYGNQTNEKIESHLIKKISQIPGVKSFIKSKYREEPNKKQSPQIVSPIPVSSIEDLKESKIRIKLK